MKDDLLTVRALSSPTHLACIKGPDRGAVLPVLPGQVLGRTVGLLDPHTSAQHALIQAADRGATFVETDPTNPTFRAGRSVHLRSRLAFWVGTNRYRVRLRPLTPGWSLPSASSNTAPGGRFFKVTRIFLPVFLVFALLRFLPGIWVLTVLAPVALLGGWWGMRRFTDYRASLDCASLALATASAVSSSVPDGDHTEQSRTPRKVPVLLRPGRKTSAEISIPGACAAVGKEAKEYALWIAGQLRVQGVRVLALPMDQWEPGVQIRGVHVYWSPTHGKIPAAIATVLNSAPTGGGQWENDMWTLLNFQEDAELPKMLGLEELVPLDPDAIGRRWDLVDSVGSRGFSVPIGVGREETIELDLVRDGPHALVVGGTGSGKSEFLSTLILALAAHHSPATLRFVFIDYKGGAGLDHLSGLPHVEQSLSDLDGAFTAWLLRAISALVHSRKLQCRKHGVRSVEEWYRRGVSEPSFPAPPARIVIVADEVRALADQHPQLLEELTRVCRQGRSLGVHLIAATQRPGGAVSAEMRSVLDLRVALRCSEAGDSIDVLGSSDAAHLPRVPGRAIIAGSEVQLAICTNPRAVLDSVASAVEARGVSAKSQFPTPLPEVLARDLLQTLPPAPGSALLGMREDPSTCELHPLTWNRDPLLIAGPPESERDLFEAAYTAAMAAWQCVRNERPGIFWAGTAPQFVQGTGVTDLGENPTTGDMAHLLWTALSGVGAGRTAILVVPRLSRVRTALVQSMGFDSGHQLLGDLLGAAQRGNLTLIATDTSPRAADTHDFGHALIRLPNLRAASLPELAHLLPHRADSLGGRGSAAEHWVSALPNRFLATGFRALAALGLLVSAASEQSKPSALSDWVYQPYIELTDKETLKLAIPTACNTGSTPEFRKFQIVAPEHLNLGKLEIDLEDLFGVPVERVPLERWAHIDRDARTVKIAVGADRESSRFLATHDSRSAPWLMACAPFGPDEGVLVAHTSTCRVKLGPRYTDVTVRTPNPNGLGTHPLAERGTLDEA